MGGMLGALVGSFAPVASSFESIATTTVGAGGVASVTFSSIPSTFTHLQLRFYYMNTVTTSTREATMQFNSDTGNNYADHQLAGDGSSASATAVAPNTNKIYMAQAKGVGFGASVIDILDYKNTNKYKTTRQIWGWDNNGEGVIRFTSGLWMNTAAITSITLTPLSTGNFGQYTQAALYGIKGA